MTFYVRFNMVDAYGRPISKRYEVRGADYAAAAAARDTADSLLQAVVGAQVLNSIITEETPFIGTLTAEANRDEGVTITGIKPDGKKTAIKIPTPLKSLYVGSGGEVDVDQFDMSAYLALFETGTGVFNVSDGETVDSWVSGQLDK